MSSRLKREVPPAIQCAQKQFAHDLPRLLNERPGQWVAYLGAEQRLFGRSEIELYEECFRRQLQTDQFLVRRIMPEMPPEIDPEELVDV